MLPDPDEHNPLPPDAVAFIQWILDLDPDEALDAVDLVQALRSLESDDQVIRDHLRAMKQFLLEVELILTK
jgi:hypothetical protein